MKMFNPPHLGEFIKEMYLDKLGLSEREVAQKLVFLQFTLKNPYGAIF